LNIEKGNYIIKGDSTQLSEAVKNLIDNSINYTMEGSIDVSLSSVDKVKLVIKDTGVGITSDDKQKLFKSGGRGSESLKINVNSTGYGLAFVKGVVEAHKGRVWAESDGRGKGSVFVLELPI
jgi:signal transduction histidine kinase